MNEQSLKNKINLSLNNSRYRLFETTGSLFARSMKVIGALDTIPLRTIMATPVENFRNLIYRHLPKL